MTAAAVTGPFAEAVRATVRPCTFLLIVPTLAAVVAAGARWQALVAATGSGVVGGWVLADNAFVLDGTRLRLSAVAAVVLLLVLGARPSGSGSLGWAAAWTVCGCERPSPRCSRSSPRCGGDPVSAKNSA